MDYQEENKCEKCEYYIQVLKTIKRYYRDNTLLDTILKRALQGLPIDEHSLIDSKD